MRPVAPLLVAAASAWGERGVKSRTWLRTNPTTEGPALHGCRDTPKQRQPNHDTAPTVARESAVTHIDAVARAFI